MEMNKTDAIAEDTSETHISTTHGYVCTETIKCHDGAVRAVRFNVDGSYCITCGSDRKLKLWNPHRNLLLKTYEGHNDDILDGHTSCNSSQILSCGADKCVILWDVETGKILRRFKKHLSTVSSVRFNENSNVAVSGSGDHNVLIWDLRGYNMEPIQTLSDAQDTVTCVRVTDHEILASSTDCKVRRYDIRNHKLYADFLGNSVMCVNLTMDGQCMLISCEDKMILIDKETGDCLAQFIGHTTRDYCLENCLDSTDCHVFSASLDGKIWCWDLVQAEVTEKLHHSVNTPVTSVSSHPTLNCLLSGSGQTVKLWKVPESILPE